MSAQEQPRRRRRDVVLDPSYITGLRAVAVQRLLADPALSYVTVLSTEDLATARDQLADYEHDISSQRSSVQEVVDVLTAELMVRYRNREATIDTLLT